MSVEADRQPLPAEMDTARLVAQEVAQALSAAVEQLAERLRAITEPKLVLTVEQAAEVLECSPALVREMINERRLPCVKLGPKKTVIPVRALEEWLDRKAQDSLGNGAE